MRIRTLKGLRWAALHRKAVICPDDMSKQKPIPAAWLINLPGTVLVRLLKKGIYVYYKKEKNKKNKRRENKQRR